MTQVGMKAPVSHPGSEGAEAASIGRCRIRTCEMHTAGEPVRIVESGFPFIHGKTILEKRAYVASKLDEFRKLLMFEPRGHRDMYGVVFVVPDDERAHAAALFLHCEGLSTMCGHATIALGRYLVDKGIVPAVSPVTTVSLQVPCGLVSIRVEVDPDTLRAGASSFLSVASFATLPSARLRVSQDIELSVAVSYGGAFYVIVDAQQLPDGNGLNRPISELVDLAERIKSAVRRDLPYSFRHPHSPDLSYLYGAILTEGSRNVCVFADAQVDRSPCGSGLTARAALTWTRPTAHHVPDAVQGPAGIAFSWSVDQSDGEDGASCCVGPYPAVRVRISGKGHYLGSCEWTAEPDDPLCGGFRLV